MAMLEFPLEDLQRLDDFKTKRKPGAKPWPDGYEFLTPPQFLVFLAACYDAEGTWIKSPGLVKIEWVERVRYGFQPYARSKAFEISMRSPLIVGPNGAAQVDEAACGWTTVYMRLVDSREPKIASTDPEFSARWRAAGSRVLPALERFTELPKARRTVATESQEIREWLDQVRLTYGEWVRYPRPVKRLSALALRGGGFGAQPGEFEALMRSSTGDEGEFEVIEPPPAGTAYLFVMNKMWNESLASAESPADLIYSEPPLSYAAARAKRTGHATAGDTDLALSEWLDKKLRYSQRPQDWRVLPHMAKSLPKDIVARITSGSFYGARPGEFEAYTDTRKTGSGAKVTRLWVRVSPDFLEKYPDYPHGVPTHRDPSLHAKELKEKRARVLAAFKEHVKAPEVDEVPETTPDGLPIWR